MSRSSRDDVPGVIPVAAGLLDPESLAVALADVDPEIVLFTAWMKKDTKTENIEVNSATVRNVLAAVGGKDSVRLGFRSTPDSFVDEISRYREASILPDRL